MKKRLARQFKSLTFYCHYLGYRVIVTVTLSIAVGVLDGFGLSMFLPLLQMVSGTEHATGESMGNLRFIVDGFHAMGISLSLVSVILIMIIFFMAKGVSVFINSSYRVIIRNIFIRKLRTQILKAFNRLTYKYFVMADVGRIQNTMGGEVERVSRSFNFYFKTAEQAILVAVYMGFAFFVDAQFALLVTIGGLLTNLLYKAIYDRTKGASGKFTRDSHGYQGQIIQHVAYFKYLKATNLLGAYGDHLRRSIYEIEASRRRIGILNAIVMGAREPLLISIVGAVILIQALFLNAPLGPILISLLFFYRALTALMNLQNSWNRYLEVSGSLSNVIAFQEELQQNRENYGDVKLEGFHCTVQIKNGWFSYNNAPVLKNISLTIEKNQTVAFVGKSGSGKTTLINILTGLIPLDKGTFSVDGTDSARLNLPSYQNRMGYITQDPVIFNDTLYNNVTFWAETTSDNVWRFWEVLKKSAFFEYVTKLPRKELTLLGNNGVNLSGGQKQRISIARELYKDIDMLIMDEATSALDTETERSIQESIESLKGQYTILIVAHRLSTIKNADKIVLMQEGIIENIDTYSGLVLNNQRFKRMVELQEI